MPFVRLSTLFLRPLLVGCWVCWICFTRLLSIQKHSLLHTKEPVVPTNLIVPGAFASPVVSVAVSNSVASCS